LDDALLDDGLRDGDASDSQLPTLLCGDWYSFLTDDDGYMLIGVRLT